MNKSPQEVFLVLWILDHFLLVILVIAGIATAAWLLAVRKRLNMSWYMALLLSVIHVLVGVLCVKVFARMEGANSSAMSIFGAVFFMPVFYIIGAKLFRRPLGEVCDLFAVPMIFTLFCSRFNCLKSGCCLGTIIPGTTTRWPTREAEMVFYVIFLAIMIPRILKGQTKGKVYPIYMIAYGIFRGIIECIRESRTPGIFHLTHIWCLVAIVIGLGIYWTQKAREEKQAKKRK